LTTTQKNKDLVRRWYEDMWNQWNFSAADDLVEPDISFRGSLGTSANGVSELKSYMQTVRQAFPDFHNHIDDLIGEGEKVVARVTYTGTHDGPLHGFKPTGRRITYAGIAIFTIRNGRISACWVLGDIYNLHKQLIGCDASEVFTDD
jgi:steroid delta-isomerase-like uncharacterized protein